MGGDTRIFVYGTLRSKANHPLHRVLVEEGTFLGMGTFQGELYNLGRFPGAIPSIKVSDRVVGEIYRLENARKVFELLDEYEGILFRRKQQPILTHGGRKLSAWIYLYIGPRHSAKLTRSGDYLPVSPQGTPSSIIRIKRISSTMDLEKAFAIRMRVFVKEQGVPAEVELDRDDRRAIHFLAICAERAAGTARVVMRHGKAKIGRMAVLKSYRRKGVGTKLLKRTVAAAGRLRADEIYLHAQVPVIGFYEKMGFRCVGPVFHEAGIPHRRMIFLGKITAKNAVRHA